MLMMNRALLLGLFMMGTLQFDLLAESIPMQYDDPGPSYEDTREFYSVSSLKKANNESSFIKLAFVVDQDMYSQLDKNSNTVLPYSQKILTLANSLFQPYNIFIALVDIIIWAESDKIDIDRNNITVTHTRFETYARNFFKNSHSIDHIVLLSHKLINTVPYVYSLIETVDKKCDLSIGVINTAYHTELDAARLIFLFGDGYKRIEMNEDLRECFKPMDSRFSYEKEFEWYFRNPTEYEKKSCIDKFMDEFAKTKTNLTCLKTKPDILFHKPVCGNNVTEPGEECDCMWSWDSWGRWGSHKKVECDNQCCDALTCRLKNTNYSCAFGECCDLNSCSKKPKKYEICRPASHPCDVEEYCDGEAPFCPIDKFGHDGRECSVKICHFKSIEDRVLFDQGTTEYKGVCNSKGICECKKKISSP